MTTTTTRSQFRVRLRSGPSRPWSVRGVVLEAADAKRLAEKFFKKNFDLINKRLYRIAREPRKASIFREVFDPLFDTPGMRRLREQIASVALYDRRVDFARTIDSLQELSQEEMSYAHLERQRSLSKRTVVFWSNLEKLWSKLYQRIERWKQEGRENRPQSGSRKMSDSSSVAPPGHIYVCTACGKMSRDLYGTPGPETSPDWAVSCTVNARLFRQSLLVIEDGRVVKVLRGRQRAPKTGDEAVDKHGKK